MAELRGSMVALVTPFKDGALDEPALRSLLKWQLSSGTDGLICVAEVAPQPLQDITVCQGHDGPGCR